MKELLSDWRCRWNSRRRKKALQGGWRLESWSCIHEDGRTREFPMGRDAQGYILYTPGGQVSATIMRADKSECFAYAGRYEVADSAVIHSIEISTNAKLVGFRAIRHIKLEDDRLRLAGADFIAESFRMQEIIWKRA